LISPEELTKSRILVDTDVVSYVFKKDTRADFFYPYMLHRRLGISFMTVAELYFGAYKNSWGANRILQLENAIKSYVLLPYDYTLCQHWARIRTHCENVGRMIEHPDIWIAASALLYDCALLTNNGKHFEHIPRLVVISPGLS